MAILRTVPLALLLCILALNQVQGQVAMAKFNGKGFKGYVKFSTEGSEIRVQTNLMGLRGNHNWHVHLLPVDQTVDPSEQCGGAYVGPHYDPFNVKPGQADYKAECSANATKCEAGDLSGKFGVLSPSNNMIDKLDTAGTLFLRGANSIVGRSVVIHHHQTPYGTYECATIRSTAETTSTVALLQGTLTFPMAGTIYFKQVEGEDVQMWGKMFWVQGSNTSISHPWHIHVRAPGEGYRVGACGSEIIQGHFDPFGSGPTSGPGYNVSCSRTMTSGCEVGDLTGKFGVVAVDEKPTPYSTNAFFFTDTYLNLTGVNAADNRSVAFHLNGGGPVIACAPLIKSEKITLKQYGVEQVTVSQNSPFEDTVITTTQTREMTAVQRTVFTSTVLDCIGSSDKVYSPYELEDSGVGVATPDQIALGKLYERYAGVNGVGSLNVLDVPVYGSANTQGALGTISGHALRTVSGSETFCSALIPTLRGSEDMVAKATFTGSIRGAIYFVQKDFGYDQLGNTLIIVDLFTEGSATNNVAWRVYTSASPSSSTACSTSLTQIHNPFTIFTGGSSSNSVYAEDCSPLSQLRCQSGDLTGKHSKINIGPDSPSRPTYSFIDSNIQLTGTYTVVGMSIGLATSNNMIFECASIRRQYLSADKVTVITSRSTSKVRSSVTDVLANEVGVDSSDILVLNQRVYQPFKLVCVEMTFRVLASTQDMANSYADKLIEKSPTLFTCGALPCVSVSMVTFILPLLVAIFHFTSKN